MTLICSNSCLSLAKIVIVPHTYLQLPHHEQKIIGAKRNVPFVNVVI